MGTGLEVDVDKERKKVQITECVLVGNQGNEFTFQTGEKEEEVVGLVN